MKQNKTFYKIVKLILKPLVKIFYPYYVENLREISNLKGRIIICSNHLCFVDPIFLLVIFPEPIFFLAKSEFFKNRILGFVMGLLGVIPIKRGKNDKKALNYAENVLVTNNFLGIFIEGTRSKTGEFLAPKAGAALLANKTQADILPVCITGSSNGRRIKMFKRTTIKIGQKIDYNELKLAADSRSEIKEKTNLIMQKIKDLR